MHSFDLIFISLCIDVIISRIFICRIMNEFIYLHIHLFMHLFVHLFMHICFLY